MAAATSEIPTSPTPSRVTSSSWFPDVALHRHSNRFVHESSYSQLCFAAVMFIVAVLVCFIPWDERAFLGNGLKVKYFIAGGIIWGGMCVLGMYWFRNARGQRLVIDPHAEKLTILTPQRQVEIRMEDIVGTQICKGEHGFQANLVYRDAAEDIKRHCLYSHASKSPCLRLARQYELHCGFPIIDQSSTLG